jgi:epothilone polyketide synthase D
MDDRGNQPKKAPTSHELLLALRKLRERVDELELESDRPIAVVGVGCRFPGGANDPEAFWRMLHEGRDGISEVPGDRWDLGKYFDPDPDAPGKTYSRWGGFLRGVDVHAFDPAFFGITAREAEWMDPQQRLVLECAWEALEYGGIAPRSLSGTSAGVFLGVSTTDFQQVAPLSALTAYSNSGAALSVIAGRLSYTLGLRGPSFVVDTACSSSLVALHQACLSLRKGESSLALAGGVSVLLMPSATVGFSKAGMLSPDGRCKTFDASANGYARGEGCGIIVLKRLDDARRDGDRVLAIIRGSTVNQDGASGGLTVPSGPAQEAAIRRVLENAKVSPADVGYVEAHGTGTSLGDPIEVRALGAVLGKGRSPERPLVIGSVKTNIGHLEPAAGAAGIIKVVLALGHGEIPPHLHFKKVNPLINLAEIPAIIPTSPMPWPRNPERPRLAGVSGFAFQGTNAHVLIEEAPSEEQSAATVPPTQPLILTLSAREPGALRELAGRYAGALSDSGIANECFTANSGRSHFEHRLAALGSDAEEIRRKLRDFAEGRDDAVLASREAIKGAPEIGFLFTGQGSQYLGMGLELYQTEPVFRRALERCAEVLKDELSIPEIFSSPSLDETRLTQPALFALEYALAELWKSWGIRPAAVIGHSVGEYVAAVTAGVMSVEDGARLIACRARLMSALPAGGAMGSIGAPEERVRAAIAGRAGEVSIAAVNAPESVVISGVGSAVREVLARFEAEGLRVKPLVVSHAFHSPLMDPMLNELEKFAAGISFSSPEIPLVSNVTGRALESCDARYWRDHVREPVRFAEGMRSLASLGVKTFVEIGPHPVLVALGQQCVEGGSWHPSLHREQSPRARMLQSLGELYVRGAEVDWAGRDRGRGFRKVALPTYPFQRRRHWVQGAGPAALPDRYVIEWEDRPAPRAAGDQQASGWCFVGEGRGVARALASLLGEHYRQVAPGEASGRVVDLRALELGDSPDCTGILELARKDGVTALVVVTRGADVSPAQSAVRGFARTLELEKPEVSVRRVDLDPASDAQACAEALVRELGAGEDTEVALRGAARKVPRLKRVDLPCEPASLKPDSVYLITGGLGALGLVTAKWMVSRGARNLVLCSRRPASAETQAAISELEKSGARVRVVQADIAVREQAAKLFSEIGAPVAGIVHAAGVLDDGAIEQFDSARLEKVLAPKALGAWNLHELAGPLDFFVLFSSLAGVTGNPGQSAYSAANAYLDALARLRRDRGTAAVSVCWGPWAEGGMAKERAERLSRLGLGLISPEAGTLALDVAFGASAPAQIVVANASWEKFEWRPLLERLADRRASGAGNEILGRLRAASDPERDAILRAHVLGQAAQVMGFEASDSAMLDRPLRDAGLDSMMAVELRKRLERTLELKLSTTAIFNYPTIRELTAFLASETQLGDRAQAAASKEAAASIDKDDPIAIIGMSCRFPGGADSPERFWELLKNGVDAISEVPAERWDLNAYFSSNPESTGKMYTRWGGFIAGADRFDASFFGISPREALAMDPQHRLLMETSWEAFERSGQASRIPSETGVFVGITGTEYTSLVLASEERDEVAAHIPTGTALNTAAGHLSYVFGLNGPSMSVDTACSSSLVALHLACQALRQGECELALVAGVNLILSPDLNVMLCRMHALSPAGRCKTFDESADGYVRSDGCGAVILKRLSEAVRDGDPVLAVVRGTAVNQDGRSSSLTAPNGLAQERVIRMALARAGVKPEQVSYVEAHGTGTPLGDPIEVQALGHVLGKDRSDKFHLGAVKANIGHLESAAGLAGVIKVVLSLQHEQIPPQPHFRKVNPAISLEEAHALVPTALVPWPRGEAKRIAGVSSFGFSGTNAHAIVEEAPALAPAAANAPLPSRHLLALSGKDEAALRALALRFGERVCAAKDAGELEELCSSAAIGRAAFGERLSAWGSSPAELAERLTEFAAGRPSPALASGRTQSDPPGVAFLFTGQGSQRARMGKDLYEAYPVFRAAIDRCASVVAESLPFPLLEVMWGQRTELLDETLYTQPALFAVEFALSELWRSWGVEPVAVIGHSVGEYVAAVVAGALSPEDGLRLLAQRASLMHSLPRGGEMASIAASEERVARAVAPYASELSIAAVNGPESVVIAGASARVREVLAGFEGQGVRVKLLTVSHAFHSPLMEPMLAQLEQAVGSAIFSRPKIRFISNLTGALVSGDELSEPAYWRRHARGCVRFADGVKTLLSLGVSDFLEVGPQPVLLSMASDCVADGQQLRGLASMRRERDEQEQLLESVGALFVRGVPVNWRAFAARPPLRLSEIPTYPFQRERFWVSPAKSRAGEGVGDLNPLVGRRLDTAGREVVYEATYDAKTYPLLAGHRVYGPVVVPGAAHLARLLAVSSDVTGSGSCVVRDLSFARPIVLGSDGMRTRRVQLVFSPEAEGGFAFQICSRDPAPSDKGEWTEHGTGTLRAETSPSSASGLGREEILSRCAEMPLELYQSTLAEAGFTYGPEFTWAEKVWKGKGESLVRMRAPVGSDENRGYSLHPGLIDCFFQSIAGALESLADRNEAFVPLSVREFRFTGVSVTGPLWCHTRIKPAPDGGSVSVMADIRLFDDQGRFVAEISDFTARRAPRAAILKELGGTATDGGWLYELAWRNVPRGASAQPAGSWVVVGAEGAASAVAEAILGRGGRASVLAPAELPRLEGLLKGLDGVVYLGALDIDEAGDPLEAQRLGYEPALRMAQLLAKHEGTPPRLVLVTRGTQQAGPLGQVRAGQAPLWGLARVVALEHPEIRCLRIDLDPSARASIQEEALQLASELGQEGREDQIALRGSERYLARLARAGEAGSIKMPADRSAYKLGFSSRGALENLEIRSQQRRKPARGEIEIRVHATGLNFRDVLNVLDQYPGEAGEPGLDCAGEVVGIGEGVEGLQVGDRVLCVTSGGFASHVTVPRPLVARIPEAVSFEEAATVPVVFLTCHYGLRKLAKLARGERVLIHAGAGGVGLAAIQMAQAAGAEVHVTVGSEEKRELMRKLGIRHIYGSRSLAFVDELLEATGQQGVDVVLNSLSGDFIPRSLGLLRQGGRFIEIGKIGIWSEERALAFKQGISYHAVALDRMVAETPALVGSLLGELMVEFGSGILRPLATTVYRIEDAVPAFRLMAEGKHIGKIVLTQEHLAGKEAVIRKDASYLISGGLGALGIAAARWLAEQGAGHVALVGRSEPSAEVAREIDKIRELGSRVSVVRGDVAKPEDVERIVSDLRGGQAPLRGVIHAAGVLRDHSVDQQNWEEFKQVFAPKVLGAVNLERATRGDDLDFFVNYSSIAALLGNPGQANYAAANAYLDALSCRARRQGRAMTSINWGAWAEVGMAARLSGAPRASWDGVEAIPLDRGMEILAQVLRTSLPQVAVFPVDWSAISRNLEEVSVLAEVLGNGRGGSRKASARSAAGALFKSLEAASAASRREMLVEFLRAEISGILRIDSARVGPSQRLMDLGLDSLMAMELRNRIKTALGDKLRLPPTLVFDHPTLDAIAKFVESRLFAGAQAAPAAEPAAQAAVSKAEAAQVAESKVAVLTDTDVSEELARRLAGIDRRLSNRRRTGT